MKKLIALLLALILSVSALTGCGDSQAAKRRDAAKGIFNITGSEYRKNSEYYDALMSDYGIIFTEESDDSGDDAPHYETYGDSGLEDLYREYGDSLANAGEFEDTGEGGWEPIKTRYTAEEVISLLENVPYKTHIYALKKGDTFYVSPSTILRQHRTNVIYEGRHSR